MASAIPDGKHATVNGKLTGSTFADVCLGGAKFDDVNLSGVAVTNANVEGMTIDGVLVTELIAAHRRAK